MSYTKREFFSNVGSVIPPEYQELAREWGLLVYSDLGILIAFLVTSLFVAALFYIGLLISLRPVIRYKVSDKIFIVMSAVIGILAAYSGAPIITMIMHFMVGYLGSLVAGAIIILVLGGLLFATLYGTRIAKKEAETKWKEAETKWYERVIQLEKRKKEYFEDYYSLLNLGEELKIILSKIDTGDADDLREKLEHVLHQKKLDEILRTILEVKEYLKKIKEKASDDLKKDIENAISSIDSNISKFISQKGQTG